MNIHLHNADIVVIIALALLCSLLLALRFRPATWKGIVVEAVAAMVSRPLPMIATPPAVMKRAPSFSMSRPERGEVAI